MRVYAVCSVTNIFTTLRVKKLKLGFKNPTYIWTFNKLVAMYL